MGKRAEPYVRMSRAPLASAVKWALAATLFALVILSASVAIGLVQQSRRL